MKFLAHTRAATIRCAAGFATLLAFTACESYNDSGEWTGTLTAHNEIGTESYSCPVDIDLTHTDEMVSLNSVDSYCGDRSLHWSPNALQVIGDEIFENDAKVGEIGLAGDVTIDLTDPNDVDHYPNRADHVTVHWEKNGDSLLFTLQEMSEGHTLTLEGSMQRK